MTDQEIEALMKKIDDLGAEIDALQADRSKLVDEFEQTGDESLLLKWEQMNDRIVDLFSEISDLTLRLMREAELGDEH